MIRLLDSRLTRHDLRTRMPFRYGIVTMTEMPHLFIEVEVEINGQKVSGIAADHLPPKWFTKDPERDPLEEIADMLRVIQQAESFARSIESKSVFDWWWQLFQRQDAWRKSEGIEALLAHFGTSLFERAVIDAYCRHHAIPFHRALRDNRFGVDWSLCEPALAGVDWSSLLPAAPLQSGKLRHTVGMVDPLRETDLSEADRLHDGLPQSLEACINFYGLSDFKLKLGGDAEADLRRLRAIASVVQEKTRGNFHFSLDANEQFNHPAALHAFGQQVYANPQLAEFFKGLLFIEQPLSRKVALCADQTDVRACWPVEAAIIIDESDGSWEDLPRALELGYSGVSHKNCKGIFKGLRNKCLIELHKSQNADERPWTTSAEDLCNIGPVALLQDLAMQATLGNESIERNGHHYFAGLAMFPKSVHADLLAKHGDLWIKDAINGCRLNVVDGRINLQSVNRAPFGVSTLPRL